MPTMMASFSARIWNTRVRAASPVIATGLRPASPALPSADTASLSVTKGRLSVTRMMWPACTRRASSSPRPTSTAMPLSRSFAWPLPATSGLGSSSADTTRAMPALMMASAQGGVLPWCAHGSSVTYSVAPCAAFLAWRSASTSACGRPPGCVQPRPTITLSLTITAPTAGLGQVLPSPRRPSVKANAMKRASSAGAVAAPCSASSLIARSFARGLGLWLVVGRQFVERGAEILGLAEIAVDARRSAHRPRRRARAGAP